MRRIAALAALGFLLPSAGCSADGDPAGSAASPAAGGSAAAPAAADPTASAAAGKALDGNTKTICEQAARTGTAFGERFIEDLKRQIDAAAQGGAAKARADEKISEDVRDYSRALADLAKRASEPGLKSALTRMSDEVTALKGDVTKVDADQMSRLTATLDQACGLG